MFVTSVLPYIYISFHPLSLSPRSFSIDVCTTSSIALGTPFFFLPPLFLFFFFFFASLFSTDKQCIVEMKIGCTAALRESLINFLIIRWSNFAIYAASRVKTTRGKNGKERKKERGDPDCWCYRFVIVERILFVESCTSNDDTTDHFESVMTTLHRLLDSAPNDTWCKWNNEHFPRKYVHCALYETVGNTVQKFSARCILFAISFCEPNTANISIRVKLVKRGIRPHALPCFIQPTPWII